MEWEFYKYQGTGNDFVLLDNRDQKFNSITTQQVASLCDRHFGIGADGLMLLNLKEGYDFEMIYYNADGNIGSMCGNGGRCIVKFAYNLGIQKSAYLFLAADGDHEARVDLEKRVSLKMKDVDDFDYLYDSYRLDTGSPHYIRFVSEINEMDVVAEGRKIRYSKEFTEKGINVNFVKVLSEDEIYVRTYERGVEDETFSCGTGVTAAALVASHNENGFNRVEVKTKGGNLSVEYDKEGDHFFRNIWLSGPATFVFSGIIKIAD